MTASTTSTTRNQMGRKLIFLFLALVIVLSALPGTALAAKPRCVERYTVKEGDTLSSIAKKFDLAWNEITVANRLKEPYLLTVGQRLCIPPEKDVKSEGKAPDRKAVDFTVSAAKRTITISGKFPVDGKFLIKVDDAQKTGRKWFKVATMEVKEDKAFKESFKLPEDMGYVAIVDICLKDQRTSVLACKSTIVYP